MKNIWQNIIALILFIIFLAMVILGQKDVGYTGLGIQALGLVGLLSLLYVYNRKHS